jgi:hypothetical protein
MSRGQTYRSGDVQFDGKMVAEFHGRIVASAAGVTFGHFIAPCDGTFELGVNVTTTPTHATSDLLFGLVSNTDSGFTAIDLQNAATGYQDLSANAAVVSLAAVKGEAYCWTFTGGDTTGELIATAILKPS